MKRLQLLALALALAPALAAADTGIMGYGGVSAVAQAPAVGSATKILILPFTAIHDTGAADAWIGKAIEQNVFVDLGKQHRFEPLLFSEKNGQVAPGGIFRAAGRTGMVVYGTYQVVEGQVRISAEVVDVNTGALVGTAKATGAARDLLALEDSISDQIRQAVLQAGVTETAAAPSPSAPMTTAEPTYPPTPYSPYAPSPAYTPPPDYSDVSGYGYPGFYDYGYIGYPYAYPFSPFFGDWCFFGGFFHHHGHDHDHDGDRGRHDGGNGGEIGHHAGDHHPIFQPLSSANTFATPSHTWTGMGTSGVQNTTPSGYLGHSAPLFGHAPTYSNPVYSQPYFSGGGGGSYSGRGGSSGGHSTGGGGYSGGGGFHGGGGGHR